LGQDFRKPLAHIAKADQCQSIFHVSLAIVDTNQELQVD
jgi:hypothetical protein